MRPEERLLGLAIPIGFVAFTLPLLYSDTKHLWASPAPRDEAPPPPPSWHQHAPDADSPKGRFRLAASSGDVASAAALVAERGKELLTVDAHSGNSPLFEAARAGHEDMVRFLLDNGAEVNRPNEWGDTPVNEAATMGHWPIVWLLVDHGAAVVTKPDGAAHSGHSGLLLAAVRHRSLEALSKLHSLGLDLNTRHYAGNTALHEAARSGEKELVSFLISARANFDAENELGRTALAEAASMGHVDVVWSLLHAGASLGSDAQRLSLAMDAVRRSSLDLLDALREAGVSLTILAHALLHLLLSENASEFSFFGDERRPAVESGAARRFSRGRCAC
jgi:ankyrin repeat protein